MPTNGLDRAHPRLFTVAAAGVGLLAVGVATALLDIDWWPLRLGVLGAMFLIFGLAGYVAIGAFRRQPGS